MNSQRSGFFAGVALASLLALTAMSLHVTSRSRQEDMKAACLTHVIAAHESARQELEARMGLRQSEIGELKSHIAELERKVRLERKTAADATRVRDTLQAELLASQDRLEKAYKDIAEMEEQIVGIARRLSRYEPKLPTPLPETKSYEGVVLGISDKVNLVLISVGAKDRVQVGDQVVVTREDRIITWLVVNKVDDGWAACREIMDSRIEAPKQGDKIASAR